MTVANLDKVIIPLIRQTMPNIIAQSIIGVQPMTAPSSAIFNLRTRYSYKPYKIFKMIDPMYYKQFLRLNNRRRAFTPEQLQAAGYPVIEFNLDQYKQREEIFEWCDRILPDGSWITDKIDLISFSSEAHATLFKLTWSE